MVISFALVMLSLSEAVFTGPTVLGLALTMQILAFRMVVARRTPAREDEPLRPALSRTVRSRPASAPGPAAR